jgi:two-component system, chemotaxis family, protein-glutamate methylesterase/glutaminase
MLSLLERVREAGLPRPIEAVVVGVSAGAIDALGAILPALPASTPWPVLVVVHLPSHEPSLLPDLFTRRCSLRVREPQDKQVIGQGIWFAPPGYHLLVESNRCFSLSIDPPVNFSRPSVDVLFQSAADAYGTALVGIVLTGANGDGAEGARVIRETGGFVMVQDPTSSEASMMPARAIERGQPQWVGPLTEIATLLRDAAIASG